MKIAIVNASESQVEILRALVKRSSHEVCWSAFSSVQALERTEPADLVLLDMRVVDPVGLTRQLDCAVLVVTVGMDRFSEQIFLAMQAGALDAAELPVCDDDALALLEKIETVDRLLRPGARPRPLALIAIGASAGGPAAIGRVLAGLPVGLPAAVVVVQHIGEAFSSNLVKLLGGHTSSTVRVAEAGHRVALGEVLVAGGTDHLIMVAGRLQYTREPLEGLYRPSIDVFFGSLGTWKGSLVGVLLTGMGSDGARGLLQLRRMGHWTIAQDESTSAIYGMPRAAAALNAACEVLPLDAIGPALNRRLLR
jgi:two-component system response regulator WspF